jgi:hypothetical protein
VLLWRKRRESDRIAGIPEDRPRSGRPKGIPAAKEEAIVKATVCTPPGGATHWSVRTMASAPGGVSPATVQQIRKKHKLQSHRIASSRSSSAPIRTFAGKVRDIAGLYLNSLDKSFNEHPRPLSFVVFWRTSKG